ncbi:MAG: nuclear transport factor 2 family protein [Steroidobacteraceae bacterium]
MSIRRFGLVYSVALGGALLLSLGLAPHAVAQDEATAPDIKAGVQVVKDWLNAVDSGDTQKAVSLMTPNVEFRFGTGSRICHGPQPVVARLNHIQMDFMPKISGLKVYAVGGPNGVAVLTSRFDTVNQGGKPGAPRTKEPFAAFFVVIHGKIDEWYENPVFMGRAFGPPRGAPARSAPVRRRPPATCASGLVGNG